MTSEEIERTLQTVAENQAKHSADIAEIDRMIAAGVESQNRFDRQLARLYEVVSGLADKQVENEKLFSELVEARRRADVRIEKLEGNYELLEAFVRHVREETHDYFAETDKKLAVLAGAQAETAGLVAEFVKDTNGRFAETDKRLAEFVSETNRRFSALERNGSATTPKAKAKRVKRAKKTAKKGSAK